MTTSSSTDLWPSDTTVSGLHWLVRDMLQGGQEHMCMRWDPETWGWRSYDARATPKHLTAMGWRYHAPAAIPSAGEDVVETPLWDLTAAELSARIGELQTVLHFKICGDPRRSFTVAPSPELGASCSLLPR